MKKIYIAIAVLATAALTSCVHEQSFNEYVLGEGDVAFVLQTGASTKSEKAGNPEKRGMRLPLGKVGDQSFCLEETITDLSLVAPQTKGTPVYTENVGTLYKDNLLVHTNYEDFEETTFTTEDETIVNGGWRYFHRYPNVPWPSNDSPVDFYMRMPADAITIPAANYDYDEREIAFDYTTPATATAQKDLIFAFASVKESEHKAKFDQGGYPVTFYHALTGVKFRNGHANDSDTKTVIKNVEIVGLKDKAHCVVTGDAENDLVTFTWSDWETTLESYLQDYSNPAYSTGLDGTVDFTSANTDLQLPNTTWTEAAADHNLNNSKGELTFWFIPQEITDDIVLKVTFCVKNPDVPNGTDITLTLDLGKKINEQYKTAADKVFWQPGQLRTYTLLPYDVDVMISDNIDNSSPGLGYVKDELHITNTGNVDEYIRVQLIGNWYGWTSEAEMNAWQAAHEAGNEVEKAKHEPDILVGYTTKDGNEMNERWFSRADHWGYFDSSFLQGRDHGNWVRGDGGYYYLQPIGPGDVMSSDPTSACSEPLFNSYTIPDDNIPTIWVLPETSSERIEAVGVHLVMTVSVQAIGIKKPDGTPYASCWDAWSAAIFPDGSDTIDPKDESHRNGAPQ